MTQTIGHVNSNQDQWKILFTEEREWLSQLHGQHQIWRLVTGALNFQLGPLECFFNKTNAIDHAFAQVMNIFHRCNKQHEPVLKGSTCERLLVVLVVCLFYRKSRGCKQVHCALFLAPCRRGKSSSEASTSPCLPPEWCMSSPPRDYGSIAVDRWLSLLLVLHRLDLVSCLSSSRSYL